MLFARHGETDYTAAGRLQGWLRVPLNAEGERQAEALAHLVAELGVRRIVASPLLRAWRTASVIAASLQLPLRPDPRLRERRWGSLEGRPRTERIEPFPEDVEPLTEFRARVSEATTELLRDLPGDDLLLVSHSGVLRQIGRVLGVEEPGWSLPTGGLCRLVRADGRWQRRPILPRSPGPER